MKSITGGLNGAAVAAVVRRPDLWPVAARAGRSLVPRSWWRRRPFLPVPDSGWIHFRLETAYGGSGDGPVRAEDLITYLEWKRDFPT